MDSVSHMARSQPPTDIAIPNVLPQTTGGNGFYDPNDPGNDIFYPSCAS
jgi:hypothetical protein